MSGVSPGGQLWTQQSYEERIRPHDTCKCRFEEFIRDLKHFTRRDELVENFGPYDDAYEYGLTSTILLAQYKSGAEGQDVEEAYERAGTQWAGLSIGIHQWDGYRKLQNDLPVGYHITIVRPNGKIALLDDILERDVRRLLNGGTDGIVVIHDDNWSLWEDLSRDLFPRSIKMDMRRRP